MLFGSYQCWVLPQINVIPSGAQETMENLLGILGIRSASHASDLLEAHGHG